MKKNKFDKVFFSVFCAVLFMSSNSFAFLTFDKEGKGAINVWSNPSQFALRWKHKSNSAGAVDTNDLQYHLNTGLTAGFMNNNFRIVSHGRTGSSFTSSWPNTGVGKADDGSYEFYVRQLYLDYRPTTHMKFHFGSFGAERGLGSEKTYFDDDGWVMGLRSVFYVGDADISLTGGHVGDISTPNVFDRTESLNGSEDINYAQLSYTRDLNEKLGMTFDYTYLDVVHYVRVAFAKKLDCFFNKAVLENMYGVTKGSGNVGSLRLDKDFDSFFGHMMNASLYYVHKTVAMSAPLGDKVQDGHQTHLKLKFPKLWKTGFTSMSLFFNYIQNLNKFKKMHAEGGLSFKF